MSWPRVQFVAAPDVGAEVRFDFSEHGLSAVLHEGFTLGSPTVFGEPGMVGRRRGYRQLGFSVMLEGSRTLAPQLITALAREVSRDENYLLFQLGPNTPPMWAHTYVTQQDALSFEHVDNGPGADLWQIDLALDSDPYLMGEERLLIDMTVGNNPASGGCFVELPAVSGDVPAPLRVEVTPSVSWAGHQSLLAVGHQRPETPYAPILWPAAAFTAGTDTGAVTASAAYFGTGYRAVSFATPTMATRLSGLAPTVPPLGRYKVLARIGRSDTSSTFALRFGQVVELGQTFWGETKQLTRGASPASDHTVYADLGEFTFPYSTRVAELDLIPNVPTPSVALQMERLSGTGSARVNGFLLIPAELTNARPCHALSSLFSGPGIGDSLTGHFDSERRTFYAIDVGTALIQGLQPLLTGTWLKVYPGDQNFLQLVHQTLRVSPDDPAQGNSDALSATAAVRAYYRPRYLWLGSDT